MTMKKYQIIFIMLVTAFLMPLIYANATSVRKITMDEMLHACHFVFEGKVIFIEARKTSQKRIHTFVTYAIQDIIKGNYPYDTITLRFSGGTVGDLTMAVGDMQFPQPGERGVYFVESLDRSQVHPLYGWSQGHFIIKTDHTGINRIMTSRKQPVMGLELDIPIKQNTSGTQMSKELSNGVAYGISLALEKQDITGLTLDEFKQILQNHLDETYE